jgi:uncharacterized protein
MKTVAVIGASNDRSKFGNKALRAFQSKGWNAIPVHPTETEVEGIPAVKEISALSERPDWITVYVRPTVLLPMLEAIAKIGCDQLWLNPGTSSAEVQREVRRLGIKATEGCSILAIGASPSNF